MSWNARFSALRARPRLAVAITALVVTAWASGPVSSVIGQPAPATSSVTAAVTPAPLPPAPGSVRLRSRVRHYLVQGGVAPRFAAPSGYDPGQLANVGATLSTFAPDLWSCTRRRGAAMDPSVAASVPAAFRSACFYEGYETLTVAESDDTSGFSRLHGGGFVPTRSLTRRRVRTQFHGAMITSGRMPTRIGRDGDTVRFDDEAAALPEARAIAAPPEAFLSTVAANERWVYVERDAQTLIAFVGRTPVMATLVSTGRRLRSTSLGEYRVVRKVAVGSMRDYDPGRGDEPYYIAGIPDIQYFHDGQAFHGVFWHDRFGTRASHGCVNLSLADAQWVFDFTVAIPGARAVRGVRAGAVTTPAPSWPQGREGHGSRVFIAGSGG